MVEFRTAYYTPMDRQYHEPVQVEPAKAANIEEPVIPLYQLGQTVPEQDPAGRFRNVIQGVQAAIRRGAGSLQLMLMTPHTNQLGGRPKAYGPEVREQLREVLKANEVLLGGVEMPTSSLTNLSGFDGRQGLINLSKQKEHLDEVRDAIKFTADVAEGGSVDLVSFEFPRPVFDASWNRKDPQTGKPLFEEAAEPTIWTVNRRTGQTKHFPIMTIESIPVALDKNTGGRFVWDLNKGTFVLYDAEGTSPLIVGGKEVTRDRLDPLKWDEYIELSKKDPDKRSAEEIFISEMHATERLQALGNAAYHERYAADIQESINRKEKELEEAGISEEGKQKINADLRRMNAQLKAELGNIESLKVQAQRAEQEITDTKPMAKFAKETTFHGYAEAACMARQETHNNPHAKMPVSVGPEIGFPDYYGGHPEEFAELIKNSRKRMVALLTQKEIKDPWTGETKPNPYFEPGMTEEQAVEEAKNHIKGCFDTGHMGMWLERFRPDLPWEKRLEEFNKWYMEQIKKLAKDDVVGSLQLVNSMSAAHGHLPPGQGIFPVVQAAREFKRQGFKGFMVSEGHEEESFEEGRILVETWRAFNSPFESSYGPGPVQRFNDVNQAYVRSTYSPRMMFGSYTPPFGEYKPWSEIPFE